MPRHKQKKSPGGCTYMLSVHYYQGQIRRPKGAAKSYASLARARAAMHRLGKQKRHKQGLQLGDAFIIMKQCGEGKDYELSSTRCRPTATGAWRCAPHVGYGQYGERRSGEREIGRRLAMERSGGRLSGTRRRKKRSRRK